MRVALPLTINGSKLKSPLDSFQTVSHRIELGLQMRRYFGVIHLIPAQVENRRVRFSLSDGQFAELGLDPIERLLKTLKMLEHQIFDVACHQNNLRHLAHFGHDLLCGVAQVVGGNDRQP
jgi:hypothetical protein